MSIWNEKAVISPSLITLDMCNLESQVNELKKAGVGMLHVDILDGHFSPSMPLGLDTVRQLRAKTDLAFDCHVMVTEPEFFVGELLDIGAEQIAFHVETAPHIDGTLNRIHAAGARAGVALKPATPLSVLDYVLEKCDVVTLMLINPGYAQVKGEQQTCYAERKVMELRELIDKRGLDTRIEIDGRISPANFEKWGNGIVDYFVCGSTCLKRDDLQGSVAKLNDLRKKILEG